MPSPGIASFDVRAADRELAAEYGISIPTISILVRKYREKHHLTNIWEDRAAAYQPHHERTIRRIIMERHGLTYIEEEDCS